MSKTSNVKISQTNLKSLLDERQKEYRSSVNWTNETIERLLLTTIYLIDEISIVKLSHSPSCSDELVLARGCSTKERSQPGDCENHVMETGQEKFCYCTHWLCNSSLSSSRSSWWCLTPAILLSWILNRLSLRALVAHSGQDSGRVFESKTWWSAVS